MGVFYLKIFKFLEVKFSIYLNRRVFVMEHSFLKGMIAEKKKIAPLSVKD